MSAAVRGGWSLTAGDSHVRRAGRSTGLSVEFDVYWLSPQEMEKEKEITTGADRLELKDNRRGHGGGQKGSGGGRVRNLVVRFMTLREDVAGGMGGTRAVG
jgi:hypothetical protein